MSSSRLDPAATARRASIITDALRGAPSEYFASVADGFKAWAEDERRQGHVAAAFLLELDADMWRRRAR